MAIFVAKSGQLQTLKGVFECKNMLREGVDYEVYDWVEQRSSASRNSFMTNIIDSSDGEIVIRLWDYKSTSNDGREYIIFINSAGKGICTCYCYVDRYFRVDGNRQGISVTNRVGNSLEIVVNPTLTTAVRYTLPIPHWGDIYHKWGYVKSNNYNYVPCKLLRDVPATLTFNNISYPANTIGMVETMSGKFRGFAAGAISSATVSND